MTEGEKQYQMIFDSIAKMDRDGRIGFLLAAQADLEYLLAHVEKLTKALQKIGLNVDRINVREKTNIEEYCREVARDALAEVGE